MKYILSLSVIILFAFTQMNFKQSQKEYPRARAAYDDKGDFIEKTLSNKDLKANKLRLYLRAFKEEKEIEVWAKNSTDKKYQKLITYEVCATSGDIGPKRKQGDLQIPEGMYHINRFNPNSNYHLSMGINYPNPSDKILGEKNKLGGDIFIHGNCVTIGCLPITDDKIKELYILCVEAKNSGQNTIPVTIFPSRLTDAKLKSLKEVYKTQKDDVALWKELKMVYDLFNENKELPTIGFLDSGRHTVSK